MSFGSNAGAGSPDSGNGDAYEYDSAHQDAVKRENHMVIHTPADSAEYLEGSLPKYQSGNSWTAGALANESGVDINTMVNPMDPSAGLD
jgi:hypothetical protein